MGFDIHYYGIGGRDERFMYLLNRCVVSSSSDVV